MLDDVVVVEAVILGLGFSLSFHCQRDGNNTSEVSLISGLFCHCQKFNKLFDVDSEVGILVEVAVFVVEAVVVAVVVVVLVEV